MSSFVDYLVRTILAFLLFYHSPFILNSCLILSIIPCPLVMLNKYFFKLKKKKNIFVFKHLFSTEKFQRFRLYKVPIVILCLYDSGFLLLRNKYSIRSDLSPFFCFCFSKILLPPIHPNYYFLRYFLDKFKKFELRLLE